MKKYIMVCDERGTSRWPSTSKTWATGGFILEASYISNFVETWNNIKLELCGKKEVELKWSHFFTGLHQQSMVNPLLSNDPNEWRKQAIWAIAELFKGAKIIPINSVVRKDRASESAFTFTKNDIKVLNTNILWVGIFGQFALFLKQNQGEGEIWFDQLGSQKEEIRKQSEWLQLRNNKWPVNSENQVFLKQILPTIKFLDSKKEPLIQVADFISGVIWAASEGDDEFLLNAFNKYFPSGPTTYTLIHYE